MEKLGEYDIYYNRKKLRNIIKVEYKNDYTLDGTIFITIKVDYLKNGILKTVVGTERNFLFKNKLMNKKDDLEVLD